MAAQAVGGDAEAAGAGVEKQNPKHQCVSTRPTSTREAPSTNTCGELSVLIFMKRKKITIELTEDEAGALIHLLRGDDNESAEPTRKEKIIYGRRLVDAIQTTDKVMGRILREWIVS